jgi:hypothetical protein
MRERLAFNAAASREEASMSKDEPARPDPLSETEARRAFLKRCGRYAVVTRRR